MSILHGMKWIDTDGTVRGFKNVDGLPRILSQDYLYQIAEGNITNHSAWSKLGYSGGATTTETDIWAGAAAYVFPTTGMQMEVVSSSANDNASGTGAKTVTIHYLTTAYAEATEDVILTGVTPVPTVATNIFRINNFRIKNFGSSVTTYRAIGNIDIRHLSDTPIYSRIVAGNTRARNSIYTVPLGKTLYITSLTGGITKASTTGNSGVITLRANYDDKIPGLLTAGLFFMPYAELNLVDQMFVRDFEAPLKFVATTDLKVSVLAGQSSTIATSSCRGWLES